MSLTKAPFWGLSAKKSLAKTISFAKTKNRKYVKVHTIPKDAKTSSQIYHRQTFSLISRTWRNAPLTTHDRLAYGLVAKLDNPPSHARAEFFKIFFTAPPMVIFDPLQDILVNPLGAPFDVDLLCSPWVPLTLRIIRGPHAGFTQTLPPPHFPPFGFTIPFRDKNDFFRITAEDPMTFWQTGYYPLDENWFI